MLISKYNLARIILYILYMYINISFRRGFSHPTLRKSHFPERQEETFFYVSARQPPHCLYIEVLKEKLL